MNLQSFYKAEKFMQYLRVEVGKKLHYFNNFHIIFTLLRTYETLIRHVFKLIAGEPKKQNWGPPTPPNNEGKIKLFQVRMRHTAKIRPVSNLPKITAEKKMLKARFLHFVGFFNTRKPIILERGLWKLTSGNSCIN